MNRNKVLLFVLLLASITFSSCSGSKTPCTVNCGGGGNATVSLTLVADTLPANPSILSFKVSIIGITLTPTSGTAQTFNPNPSIVVDLMRLQSDTAFLGTLTKVPSGSYTVQVSLSSPEMTFLNDTPSTITANGVICLSGLVCTATLTAVGTPTISSFTFNANTIGQQGIEIDFNLKNAISLSGGTLSVNFNPSAPNPGVFTAFTLPRTNANLGTSQLELIEDFTGVVSVSGSTVTITSPTRGALATTVTSSSFFDQSPAPTNLCPSAPNNCAAAGQIASVDAFLNADGTLSLKEFEPLVATQKDFVEGIVSAVNTQTQFAMVVGDKVQAATNSLIAGLNVGDRLTVNIPSATINPFLVDTKGLAVQPGSLGLFQGQTNTTAIHPGQRIAVNVTSFAPAAGNAIAAVSSSTVTLRWSRFTATPTGVSTIALVSVNTLPTYFNFTPSSIFGVQVFSGTLGLEGVTNLDGFPSDTSNVTAGKPVAFRALFIENAQLTASPAFFAAKVRQH
jgi:hypothetical protein